MLIVGGDIECRLSVTADTPLMMAAYHGHIDVLQLLIGHRSDINAVSSCGIFIIYTFIRVYIYIYIYIYMCVYVCI